MEATMENVQGINQTSARQKAKNYCRHPGSLAVCVVTIFAAVLTIGALLTLIIWVLWKGIPNLSPELFSLNYTSDNQSMLPAILNTVIITVLALLIAVPVGIGSAIYLVEYAKKGNRFVNIIPLTTGTTPRLPLLPHRPRVHPLL